jgi:hypothetical protein
MLEMARCGSGRCASDLKIQELAGQIAYLAAEMRK